MLRNLWKRVTQRTDNLLNKALIRSERTDVSDLPMTCLWCEGGPKSWRHAFGFARLRYVVPTTTIHGYDPAPAMDDITQRQSWAKVLPYIALIRK